MHEQSQQVKLDPVQWKEYMPQLVHQQSQDIIIFCDVKISLQKLQKIMRKKQIESFFTQVKQMIDHTINHRLIIRGLQQFIDEIWLMLYGYRLEYVPKIFLQAVTQSTRLDYFHPRCSFISSSKFPYLRENPLIKQIAHIKFTNLTQLKVKNYWKINNAQVFTFIDAPHLKQLNIVGSQVVSLDVLYKAHFLKLEKVEFYSNPITNLYKFSRFNCKNLNGQFFTSYQKTLFDRNYHKFQYSPLESYLFLFKLESSAFEIYNKTKGLKKNPSRILINQLGTSIQFYESRMKKSKKQKE